MNKKGFCTFIVVILTIHSGFAQKDATVSIKEFKSLIGCWQGTLTHSGTILRKPFTTTAELIVKQIGKSNQFEFLHIYTKEQNDKVTDTITISKDGKKLNHDTIKSKRYTGDGNLEVTTEALGFDHDNDKAAIVRQIYTLGTQLYTYKKQVQPEGQTEWLERQEFKYERMPCSLKRVAYIK